MSNLEDILVPLFRFWPSSELGADSYSGRSASAFEPKRDSVHLTG